MGISISIIIFSISAINIIIVALLSPAVLILPHIICKTVITGAKPFITVHKVLIYEIVFTHMVFIRLKMDREMQREEHNP